MNAEGSIPAQPSDTGLTAAQARSRLERFGRNEIAEARRSRWRSFVAELWSPIPWLLELTMALQLVLGRYLEAAAVGALLLFNATLGFLQQGRAEAALAALRSGLALTAFVRRDARWIRVPAAEIVQGDIVRLLLGAMVPADVTIVSGAVMVDQSAITGESVPIDAATGSEIYAGSLVRRGQAVARVTATGARTRFGRAAELVRIARARSTQQAAIFSVTRSLALVNGAVAILVVAYGHAIGLPAPDVLRLALTALLATIPVALPATFTLSAAFAAQVLARRGVLLTRLSAVHEAAAMQVLCSDKTGTLTRNALQVAEVVAMPGFGRQRVLELAALASADVDADPIDAAIRAASPATAGRVTRFVPFDPSTRLSEASVATDSGEELRAMKGALEAIERIVGQDAKVRRAADDLACHGHRVIGVAAASSGSSRLAGLVAISDPAREDSAAFVAELRGMGVRTIMVTGDSPATARAIAAKVGITGKECSVEVASQPGGHDCGVFARVVPEEKFQLVKTLQARGQVVGMCGDGTNDAPALRQAQIGIAVSTATDAAKSAAGMVLTQPGLSGIVHSVREGRVGAQRLLTYAMNMLVKKFEIVLFLAAGLVLTGQAVMTPVLMVLMLITNDFLAMSLTTDRPTAPPRPASWHMPTITTTAMMLAACKLVFSVSVIAIGKFRLGLTPAQLQTLALVTLVFGAQALLLALRERRRMWSSRPSRWVLISSIADVAIVSTLAVSGTLMAPLPWRDVAAVFAGSAAFSLLLDSAKLAIQSALPGAMRDALEKQALAL